jgi:hypothetical protein
MFELEQLEVGEIATALADQTDYEHRWLIDPRTGKLEFWTSDAGIDGQNPVDVDELDLTVIEPLPSRVWYRDMADFAERVRDEAAGRRLVRAIGGKSAFRRFKDELHQEYPEMVAATTGRNAGPWIGRPGTRSSRVRRPSSISATPSFPEARAAWD